MMKSTPNYRSLILACVLASVSASYAMAAPVVYTPASNDESIAIYNKPAEAINPFQDDVKLLNHPITFGDQDVTLGSLVYTFPKDDTNQPPYPPITAKNLTLNPPNPAPVGGTLKGIDVVGIQQEGASAVSPASLTMNIAENLTVDYNKDYTGSAIMNNKGQSTITVGKDVVIHNGYVTNDDTSAPDSSLTITAGHAISFSADKALDQFAITKSGTLSLIAPEINTKGDTNVAAFRGGIQDEYEKGAGTLNINGKLNMESSPSATLSADGKTATEDAKGKAILSLKGSAVNVSYKGNSNLNGSITAEDDGTITIAPDKTDGSAELHANSTINAQGTSKISLDLGKNGQLIGNIPGSDTTAENTGTVNLNLNDNGTWLVTGPSHVTDLSGTGVVKNLATDTESTHPITIDKITGDNVSLDYTIDPTGKPSAPVKVAEGAFKNISVNAPDISKLIKDYKDPITVLTGAKKQLPTTTVRTEDTGLTKQAFTLSYVPDGSTFKAILSIKPEGTSTVVSGLRDLASTLGLQGQRIEGLMDRGTLHTYGPWTRIEHNRFEDRDNTLSQNSYTLGYTLTHRANQDLGLAVTQDNGTANLANGKASSKNNKVSLYATQSNPSGTYSDFVLSFGHAYGSVTPSASTLSNYSATQYALSAETGIMRKLKANRTLTTQAQVQFTHTNDFAVTVGTVTGQFQANNSTVGRLGLRLDTPLSANSTWFASADLYHAFTNNQKLQFTDTAKNSLDSAISLDGTWARLAIGGTVMTHNTNIQGLLSKNFGHEKGYTARLTINRSF